MKKKFTSKSAFFNPGVLIGLGLCLIAVVLALLGFGFYPSQSAVAQPPAPRAQKSNIIVVHSIHNDVSPPLRDMPIGRSPEAKSEPHEENPNMPHRHRDGADHQV
jgi:hypothetical protein